MRRVSLPPADLEYMCKNLLTMDPRRLSLSRNTLLHARACARNEREGRLRRVWRTGTNRENEGKHGAVHRARVCEPHVTHRLGQTEIYRREKDARDVSRRRRRRRRVKMDAVPSGQRDTKKWGRWGRECLVDGR